MRSFLTESSIVFCLFGAVTNAHNPIDCFSEGLLLGGLQNGTFEEGSDLDSIEQLGIDHQLTSIKTCTDRGNNYVRGVQVTYGRFDE